MSFEEVLATCLADLEQGRSVEECLAAYPAQRAELAPILQMIAAMRNGPKPRLSEKAFARGRMAVAAYARHQEKLREPFTAARPGAGRVHPFYSQPTIPAVTKTAPPKPATLPLPTRRFRPVQRLAQAVVLVLFIISFAALVRGVATSLPGSLLYPVKGWGENAQGLLMLASGQEASWHVNQHERRLSEFAWLTQQGKPIDSSLTMAIDDHLQAALDSSSTMTPERRQQFLAAWLAHLHHLQNDLPVHSTTVATLNHAIATVEQATEIENAPTILPAESTPTPTSQSTPTNTPTSLMPSVTPTETDTPTPIVLPDTPTPTNAETLPAPVETATALATPVATTPTAVPTLLEMAPTVTQVPQLIPGESNSAGEGSESSGNKSSQPVTPTSIATPATPEINGSVTPPAIAVPPRIPLPTLSGTDGPVSPSTPETPETTKQTPMPGSTPTQAEPPTPAATPIATEKVATPTRSENKTSTPEATKPADPTATEKAATPTRVENKTSTPEPTKVDNNSPTNTPKPEETKAETPEPDNETPVADETPADPDAEDEPTPEPTPTPKKKKK